MGRSRLMAPTKCSASGSNPARRIPSLTWVNHRHSGDFQRTIELDRATAKVSNHQYFGCISSNLELTIVN
jgi:hypothetical protein